MALVLSALSLITVSAQAKVQPGVWAFLYSDKESPPQNYEPPNQAGVKGAVTKTETGRYRVDLAAAGTAGVPMVTAVNEEGVHCQLASFTTSVSVNVDCYRGADRIDSRFTLTFFSRPADGTAGTAYGYAHSRSTLLRYPEKLAVSPPQNNQGIWTVRFFDSAFVNPGGNVQVSAVGSLPARCAVVGWFEERSAMVVQVKCQNLSTQPVYQPQWTLVYTHQRSIVGGDSGVFGYLQADMPGTNVGDEYTPTRQRNVGPRDVSHTVTRTALGRYRVQVHGPLTEKVTLHVSANSDTNAFCNVMDFDVDPNNQERGGTVDVACYNSAGNAANNKFTLNYYSFMT